MKSITYLAVAASILCACGNKASTAPQQEPASESGGKLPPVETSKPVPAYKPVVEGQTRIAGVKTKTPYSVKAISTDLDRPWAVAAIPDGRLLITEKGGTMRIATTSGTIGSPISGVPPVDSAGQGGLLDVEPDPDFTSNRMIYWTFAEQRGTGNHTSVAKGRLSDDEKRLENVQVIFRALPEYDGTLHYGSRIAFDRSGNLFVSTGERSDIETRPQAQWLNSGLGKIVRITKDGKPVAGNPFIGQKDAMPEIWTYGHRNVQGLAIHPETGELWNSEMGPKGGDEINLIEAGKNYGWPTITYGVEYSGKTIGEGITQKTGMEQPVYYWDPVLSPSGMTFYSGDRITEWKNNLFIGGLSSRHIARIVIENNKVTGEERLLVDQEQRFRDLAQGADGALYAVTDEGRLYRIAAK